jgi:hypothetical protein
MPECPKEINKTILKRRMSMEDNEKESRYDKENNPEKCITTYGNNSF